MIRVGGPGEGRRSDAGMMTERPRAAASTSCDRDEPERDEPERDEPERDGPERDGPERDEPERDEPQRDEPERGASRASTTAMLILSSEG